MRQGRCSGTAMKSSWLSASTTTSRGRCERTGARDAPTDLSSASDALRPLEGARVIGAGEAQEGSSGPPPGRREAIEGAGPRKTSDGIEKSGIVCEPSVERPLNDTEATGWRKSELAGETESRG